MSEVNLLKTNFGRVLILTIDTEFTQLSNLSCNCRRFNLPTVNEFFNIMMLYFFKSLKQEKIHILL
jgi:hypothetical protein